MQISIIIVSYNVKYFLEHCLHSVRRACEGLESEVWVVDNQSGDDSVVMMQQHFPEVQLIINKENVGFAKANNQALEKVKGDYVLFLNPDTILPEDALKKSLAFMEAHPDAGALGCRLIDGQGQFLPESKRGFPSAKVAFFRLSGLSSLFKKSKTFNQYHLGYLPEMEVNEVDVLVGCFMFCRKTVLDKTGGFDEDYFMYGEDIDLSYKIKKAGFKNYYFPVFSVIHYKGESTKKGSLNYVKMFYQAMIIFAGKHFESSKKGLFVLLIRLAIYFRAIMAFAARVVSKIKLPLMDAALLLIALVSMKVLWIKNVKTDTQYPNSILIAFFSLYILIWVTSMYFNGAYDKPYKSSRATRGMLIGGIISLAIYGLMNEEIRFSRGITVLGALMGTLLLLLLRKIFRYLNVEDVDEDEKEKKVIIVGTQLEESEIRALLDKAFIAKNIIGTVSPYQQKENFQLGSIDQLKPICQLYGVNEVIFAQQQLSFKGVIEKMELLGKHIRFKLHSIGTDSIIGSNSKNTAGDLYTTEQIYEISSQTSKRNKRMVDLMTSFLLLLCSPLLIWFVKHKASFLGNLFLVLEGDKTFVGYKDEQFPPQKPHLLNVYPMVEHFIIPEDNREHLDWLYAKNYSAWMDVKIIWEKWREL